MAEKNKFEKIDEQIEGYTLERQPGFERDMEPKPIYEAEYYKGSGKLTGKTAIITGGDSGIGRAVALLYAKEGADLVLAYLDEHKDAEDTKAMVETHGVKCELYPFDVKKKEECTALVDYTLEKFGKLNILVNHAGVQYPTTDFVSIPEEQVRETFETNIYGIIFLTQAALPHLGKGDSIINTTSITAYNGSPELMDYSATNGAITSLTRSLAGNLAKDGIRVNAVAPGPIYTPLIPASFDQEKVEKHGGTTPMGRRGQPSELGPSYVFLASADASYMTGQVIHVNGGDFMTT
ncbi:SDR family oxidoreductase [Salinicoccus halodurans]|uniref:Diacetyl reductase [(S)-acetoin forming] n=1 Tax=Salinicoccus halodurans TaxID=407035 RepID=A0A0F7HJB8_9STAP|nr:SDR family oxidoreductase [Salinicoccus halodurans]AKG73154.1 short-chain dehydrogenase [Salinicoccus halodurans]SFK84721.1 NAD(P)-dependent dehydrogenase, short-chain alcohol dehydrogenase family [Salinicoccus halodurans]